MTLRELLDTAAGRPEIVAGLLLAPPVIAFVLSRIDARPRPGRRSRWPWLDALLLYWTTLPGVLATLLIASAFLFGGGSLLDVDLVTHYLPPIAMVVTLALIGRRVDFDRLPGGERLTAFVGLVAVSFVLAFVLHRMRIWLVFGGSVLTFFLLAAVLFVALRWFGHRAMAGRRRRR